MGLGIAVVKWPLLPDASTMPLYEGVTLCLLTAMSVLALLGLRYPVRTLPVLLFETAWKVLWLGLVALPHAAAGSLDRGTTSSGTTGQRTVMTTLARACSVSTYRIAAAASSNAKVRSTTG